MSNPENQDKWVKKFPKPEGDQPPHPGEPPVSFARPDWKQRDDEWNAKLKAFNGYAQEAQHWVVAEALDELTPALEADTATPVERICYVLGTRYLTGEDDDGGIFGSLFGGRR